MSANVGRQKSTEEGVIEVPAAELARLAAGYTLERAARRIHVTASYLRHAELHGVRSDLMITRIENTMQYRAAFLGERVAVPRIYYRALRAEAKNNDTQSARGRCRGVARSF
ncbi:MAG: hypothetical protein P4L33_10510 [Capsulimonadaceae bacterium]|nr:hypothetical protein [Capsulimonadaceae bacterium]